MIIFSYERELNEKLMKTQPKLVRTVVSEFTELASQMNRFLKTLQEDYKSGRVFSDMCKCNMVEKILKQLNERESILYSCALVLGRSSFFKKKRIFLVTDFQIYLIKGTQIARKIAFSRLRGVTYSKTNSREMIIHVKNEEDIYFQDEDLGEIEEVVKYVYFKYH